MQSLVFHAVSGLKQETAECSRPLPYAHPPSVLNSLCQTLRDCGLSMLSGRSELLLVWLVSMISLFVERDPQ
jgi:hypothetical protein